VTVEVFKTYFPILKKKKKKKQRYSVRHCCHKKIKIIAVVNT